LTLDTGALQNPDVVEILAMGMAPDLALSVGLFVMTLVTVLQTRHAQVGLADQLAMGERLSEPLLGDSVPEMYDL
jgi:hypothetical protein